ncbi:MAG TPA: dihydrofolate reductase family protein [Anaerolineales bacterium]|nr:dihydrofolate reductase family protein [Anaerolineales bacterium]
MRRIIVSEFLSLDGVMEDPGGAEKTKRGGWAFQFERGPEGDKFKLDEVMEAGALLLGRVTYEGFAEAWPSRDGEFADKMNGMPKYVVSTTLKKAAWNNTQVIKSNLPEALSGLKAGPGGDILVAGSGRLAQTLAQHGLVDEYRLMVYPVILGAGKRLFEGTSASSAGPGAGRVQAGWRRHPDPGLSSAEKVLMVPDRPFRRYDDIKSLSRQYIHPDRQDP